VVTHGNPLGAAGLAIICSMLSAGEASAGPPFRTDDPVPVAYGHYELYTAAIGTHVKGDTYGGLPNVEQQTGGQSVDYGRDRQKGSWLQSRRDRPTS